MAPPFWIARYERTASKAIAPECAARGMKIISLNVGLPRTVSWKGQEVTTAIFKDPVSEPVMLRRLNLDGDHQADLEVHGGRTKAVYAYASEHYEPWRKELREPQLSWGNFGENWTTEGLLEEDTCIGDQFRIGDALVMVTQPRFPCYKLAIRMDRDDILKRFLKSRRSGIYLAVSEEGLVNTGDTIERVHRDPAGVTIVDVNQAYIREGDYVPLMRRAVLHEKLPNGVKSYFLQHLAELEDPPGNNSDS
jgi:MOSC domain-containing protein YiiM